MMISKRSEGELQSRSIVAMRLVIGSFSILLFVAVFGFGWALGLRNIGLWLALGGIVTVLAGIVACLRALQNKYRCIAEEKIQNCEKALKIERDIFTQAQAELRKTHDAAIAANEAKTRYLISVSHDIRSPLNTIYGYAQLLERGTRFSPTEAGAVIRQSAEYLTSLVEALLEVSKIESRQIEIQSDVVSIKDLLDHIVMMFQVQAHAKGLKLNFVVHDPLPTKVKTDEKRLRQILVNLLSNAIKYTDAGCVTLSVHYRSEVARIEVSDTGTGVEAHDLERIFEPFERGRDDQTRGKPGIGLGLAITRVLTQMLGGDITVESHLDVGSKFCLRLMLPSVHTQYDKESVLYSKGKISGYEGRPRCIVVVDNDVLQCDFLEALLVPLGFVVHKAHDGHSGMQAVIQSDPDMVLLDMKMPSEDGLIIAAKIRSQEKRNPAIVIVSANTAELSADAALAACYDDFVTKPVDSNALLATIGNVLHLEWIYAEQNEPESEATLRSEADFSGLSAQIRQHFPQIRQAAELGHIRGVETVINSLAIETESDKVFVAIIKRYAHDFDLAAITRAINDAEL
ncbi:hybrid sensor histidine kinase/response regulator [Acetobacter orientalis]|uniref:ATP-binding response regulator n=1 Tax=Acetobacter orientalis TaxID=146474 RepID=UPI0039EBD8A0